MSPNPIDDEELYDAIVVAGRRSPGQVTLSGHDLAIGWDVKKGSGQAGASMTRTSEDPIQFSASFYLTDVEDFAAWPSFLELVKSSVAGTTPKALDAYHPDLAEVGITSIVLAKQCGTVHDGKGGQTKTLLLSQYRPPQPKGGSPKGSTAKKTSAPDPNQAALDELARLTEQYQKTEWG